MDEFSVLCCVSVVRSHFLDVFLLYIFTLFGFVYVDVQKSFFSECW